MLTVAAVLIVYFCIRTVDSRDINREAANEKQNS